MNAEEYTTLWMGCKKAIHTVSEIEALELTHNYVAEPKYDGWFGAVTNINTIGTQIYTRTGRRHPNFHLPPLPTPAVVVGELAYGTEHSTAERLKVGHDFITVFDILFYDGEDMMPYYMLSRRRTLEYFLISAEKKIPGIMEFYRLAPQWRTGFVDQFRKQHEGLVLKGLDSGPYVPGERSRTASWIKAKKKMTIDMVVMSYTLSTAKTFEGTGACEVITCGAYNSEGVLVPLTEVGSMEHALKIDIGNNFDKYKGRVVELNCFGVFKSGALRHPSLITFRQDKAPQDCRVEDILAMSK